MPVITKVFVATHRIVHKALFVRTRAPVRDVAARYRVTPAAGVTFMLPRVLLKIVIGSPAANTLAGITTSPVILIVLPKSAATRVYVPVIAVTGISLTLPLGSIILPVVVSDPTNLDDVFGFITRIAPAGLPVVRVSSCVISSVLTVPVTNVDMTNPYTMAQREPASTMTVTPGSIVIGPALRAFLSIKL